jgi:hypothetical protein
MQMQSIKFVWAFIFLALISACDSSSRAVSSRVEPGKNKANTRKHLMGTETPLSRNKNLYPLSGYFGVCVMGEDIWRAILKNSPLGAHYPTEAEIKIAGGFDFSITVGKFGQWPGAVLSQAPVASPPRRIQFVTVDSDESILVSDFDGAEGNLVNIAYDDKDPGAQAEALRFANNVVGCHLSN